MQNVCNVCGYDYRESGDSAHLCNRELPKIWNFSTEKEFLDFISRGGIVTKYPLKLCTGPIKNETIVEHKYAMGGLIPEPSIRVEKEGMEVTRFVSELVDPSIKANFDQNSMLATMERLTKKYTEKLKEADKVDINNASRFDSGKVDWSQVPFQALEGMVRVLEFGAKKYAKGNWANGGGFDHSRVFNSLMRHLVSYQSGEDLDPESGLPHLDHIMCNAMFMAYYKKNPETFNKDDRVNWPKDKMDKRDM